MSLRVSSKGALLWVSYGPISWEKLLGHRPGRRFERAKAQGFLTITEVAKIVQQKAVSLKWLYKVVIPVARSGTAHLWEHNQLEQIRAAIQARQNVRPPNRRALAEADGWVTMTTISTALRCHPKTVQGRIRKGDVPPADHIGPGGYHLWRPGTVAHLICNG